MDLSSRFKFVQSLLRDRTYGKMTRAQEERMRAENRRREYMIEDQKKMVTQDKLLKYGRMCVFFIAHNICTECLGFVIDV